MSGSQRVRVELASRSYDIVAGNGVLDDAAAWEGLGRGVQALVVSNTTVAPLYAQRVSDALKTRCSGVAVLELGDGESHKVWGSVEAIVDALLARGADRASMLVALGGGVVGDVTGFAAACYMRGIDYVQVPTTLLAQVDSSVGGKTAINHPLGKNMIGAFHQPLRVIADVDTLRTLPQRELVAGLAEVIKHGAIADDDFLAWIEANLALLLGRDAAALQHAVVRSCEIKAAVVADDEREAGQREVLNFGHTFGHAIEAGLGFGVWLHGEAVGCGMVLAARASAALGLIDGDRADRVTRLVANAGLPVRPPDMAVDRWIELMRHDKKSRGGSLRLVLLDAAGSARTRAVGEDRIRDLIGAALR